MPHHPPSSLVFALTLLLLGLLVAPPAGASGGPKDTQSLEACAARKLEAAARHCDAVLDAQARGTRGFFARLRRERALDRAERQLERSWSRIEATSLESGRACADSTGGVEPVQARIGTAAEDLADRFDAGGSRGFRGWLGHWLGDLRRQHELGMSARLCRDLLDAEADHLQSRFEDRRREGLEADRARAVGRFGFGWWLLAWLLGGSADGEGVVSDLEGLVASVVGDVAVAPQVSPQWEMVEPPAVVDYRGRELRPTCWDGDPWVFFVRRGTENNLLMYYQGGGACWNPLTCGGIPGLLGPTFKQSTGPGDDPANASRGFADLEDPENPFRDWHAVFVPYCTGDVHWGDAVVDYPVSDGELTVRHKGFVNAQVAEKFAREHFVHPGQVFVTGSSAGAYGAIVNSLYLQEDTYPSADFSVVGDGGNGVITQDFLTNDLAKWGIEKNLPSWMPGLNVPLGELQASDLYVEAAETYPWNRFATYTTAYDGGQGGQTGFFQIMRSGQNILEWPRWWDSSCPWNERMLELNQEAAMAAPENFRFYVGTGSRHTMWGSDKVYDDTTGGVPTVRDWLVSMLEEGPGWTNVVADDFGVLLPGDPRPVPGAPLTGPPFEPFDLEAERIVCGE